ncbi:hypothetical protein MRX96_038495, partial [Rhipicephalus microplus]
SSWVRARAATVTAASQTHGTGEWPASRQVEPINVLLPEWWWPVRQRSERAAAKGRGILAMPQGSPHLGLQPPQLQLPPSPVAAATVAYSKRKLSRNIIDRYLRERGDMMLVILHATVVQRSYATKKRFIFPPPCVYLLGDFLQRKRKQLFVQARASRAPISVPSSAWATWTRICSCWTFAVRTTVRPERSLSATRTSASTSCSPSSCFMATVRMWACTRASASS